MTMTAKQMIKRTAIAFPNMPPDEIWLAAALATAHLLVPTYDNDNDIATQFAVGHAVKSRKR